MRFLILLVSLVCCASGLYLKQNEADAELKSEMLEYLESASRKRDYLEARYDDEEDFEADNLPQLYEPIQDVEDDCDYFDITSCPNQNCMLGYETDDFGCVTSCECKQQGLFEGDIRVDADDQDELCAVYGNCAPGRAANKYLRRWNNLPDQDGNYRVPYELTTAIKANRRAVMAIKLAMKEYAKLTCLRFIERTNEKDYLRYFVGGGCYSYIGRRTGAQVISIGRGCEWKGTVMHEMMHAMGFWHEQSRPDRDDFVTILFRNIKSKFTRNFQKMDKRLVDSMGSPYDLNSIMHYRGSSFTSNGKPTIVIKGTNKPTIGQRNGFSDEDVKQLNMMYKCDKR